VTVISVRPPGAAAKARRPAALAREFHWPQCPVGRPDPVTQIKLGVRSRDRQLPARPITRGRTGKNIKADGSKWAIRL
jgi:hypothetical protein